MIGFPALLYLASKAQVSNQAVWTTGFSRHDSRSLPSGLMLLIEDGFYPEGNRDRVKLTWFRRDGSKFRKARAFEGMATLDDLPPEVVGDRVRVKTVDEPHVFLVSSVDDTFGREFAWNIRNEVPCLVSCKLLAPRLRIVDAAIWDSWRAKHPSSLQTQLRKAWPERDDLISWSEKRNGSTWTVKVNHDDVFTLKKSESGKWIVVAFSHESRRTAISRIFGVGTE